MTILEFTGCPGVGKSTICISVKEQAARFGKKVYQEQKEWRLKKVQYFFILICIFLTKECRVAAKEGIKRISNLKDSVRKKWFFVVLYDIFCFVSAKRQRCDLIFYEEGCIQSLTALEQDEDVSKEILEWYSIIYDMIFAQEDLKIVLCSLDLDENIKRIKSRKRENDRFLVGSNDEIKSRLLKKEQNLLKLCDIVPTENILKIDTSRYSEACGKILSELR